jgi:23S rRNA (uracil1939-C5)-methyltransferase
MVNGGYGLGNREDGKAVLARFALPGESVSVSIDNTLSKHDLATVVSVVEPHAGRITPPCPYYTRCGGCDLQHSDYPTQLAVKQDILVDLLERSRLDTLKAQAKHVSPVCGSEREFGYRQRVRLKLDPNFQPGFNEFRSHKVLPITRCLLAPEPINACLGQLPESGSFQRLAPIIDEVEILFSPIAGDVCLLLHLNRPLRPAEREPVADFADEIDTVDRTFVRGENFALTGPFSNSDGPMDNLLAMSAGLKPPLRLNWEIGGFSQVNFTQNERLIALVLELADISDLDRVLDLYCGMGNFAIPLARYCGWVHGIENQGSAIRSAIHNSNLSGLLNTSFQKSDVASACADLCTTGEMFDLVICDPPRQGLGEALEYIVELTSGRLIYISCDPATLCRDLERLADLDFAVQTIRPIDMFPQTHHIETVVLLEKGA